MRILVAEDEFTARALLAGLLEPLGRCDVAGDGQGAITAAKDAIERGQPFDLICLDIVMPRVDGKEALREIRRCEAAAGLLVGAGAATIIMTTAHDEGVTIMSSFADQADAYIVKPVQHDNLMKTLTDLGLIESERA